MSRSQGHSVNEKFQWDGSRTIRTVRSPTSSTNRTEIYSPRFDFYCVPIRTAPCSLDWAWWIFLPPVCEGRHFSGIFCGDVSRIEFMPAVSVTVQLTFFFWGKRRKQGWMCACCEGVWGSSDIAPPILNLGTRWREWSLSRTGPVYSRAKNPWYRLNKRLGLLESAGRHGTILQPLDDRWMNVERTWKTEILWGRKSHFVYHNSHMVFVGMAWRHVGEGGYWPPWRTCSIEHGNQPILLVPQTGKYNTCTDPLTKVHFLTGHEGPEGE